ncbi:FIST signal transduction protein [Spiribacter vilamensis]|uniref:FIST-like protein n=1 Tax=Spiribacter vilamensis TaxID=531306 RepID=A0A4Q8CZ41_9GAMM|nr:FIST C-terminal domain-containing protein [Spiribacter vilamensis]RZU98269.1 FIST-like protein [Spiribacter vilamensis]TVO60837.1 histidine kinase [Spiribacter vilamensis]
MRAEFDPTGTVAGLVEAVRRLHVDPTVHAALVFAADGNNLPTEAMHAAITASPLPLLGGIFPAVAYRSKSHERGTLVVGLDQLPDYGVVGNLSATNTAFERSISAFTDDWPDKPRDTTYLVVVDGLAARISDLIEALFFSLGLEQNFIGGGAGSLSFRQSPCIITPEGLHEDGALVARLAVRSAIGVSHGWHPISRAMTVTESEGNRVRTIDWQPAAELYAREVFAHGGQQIDADNFFSIAKSYPLGIARYGAEVVVRDPLMMNEAGEIVCVGEVPAGCPIRLLNGDVDTLLSAAGNARREAITTRPQEAIDTALMFDCISRVLFLGDELGRELYAVGAGTPIHGAFTLGEIANSGRDYLDFLNKSIVYAILD